jgi:hypothetical protein
MFSLKPAQLWGDCLTGTRAEASGPASGMRRKLTLLSKTFSLIAITHNLAAQIFYDQTYLLPSSLTVRADAHADGFDLRSAAESKARRPLANKLRTCAISCHLNQSFFGIGR